MPNNINTSSANYSSSSEYINNFYKANFTVSSNQDSAVVAFFENLTGNEQSAKILASSVTYTAMSQGIDPLVIIDQMKNMNVDERNQFTSTFLNFNRVGTSQLGVRLPNKYNKFIQRMILPPLSSYADGSSPDRAAANARSIKRLTGTTVNGYYWIRGVQGRPMQVYCDMNASESGSSIGGWMKFDNNLLTQYLRTAIDIDLKNYYATPTSGFNAQNPRNGILRGIRWDFGPYLKVIGIRITRVHFNNVGGQDGWISYDAPTPGWANGNPTTNMVLNFIQEDYDLGNNQHSYGWAIGNGRNGSTDLVRLYKQAPASEWPPQFAGLITLSASAFYQLDETSLTGGRYLYYYESDSDSEYNNLIDYVVWLR